MTDLLRSSQPAAEVAAVALTVSDAPAAARFFEAALDFEVVADPGEHATTGGRSMTVRLGSETVVLHERRPLGRPLPADSRSNDLWFQHVAIVVREIRAACDRLDALGIQHTSPTPQRLPSGTGSQHAIGLLAGCRRGWAVRSLATSSEETPRPGRRRLGAR